MAPPRSVLVAVVIAVAAAAVLQPAHRHTDAWAPRVNAAELRFHLPSPKLARVGALGYEALIADLLWIQASSLFGERYGAADDDWYSWLYQMIDLATELDPEFRAVYKYGGTMLRADNVFVEQSSLVFSKGAEALPDEWFFHFAIAMNYYMHREDRRTAALHMKRAAETGAGPFYLKNLAASLLSDTERLEEAQIFLREEVNNLEPGQARRAVEVKLFELDYLIAARDAKAMIDRYRRARGALPSRPDAVAEVDGLALPADPLGGGWEFDPAPDAPTGAVRSTRYCEVFVELAQESGLGRVQIDVCPR